MDGLWLYVHFNSISVISGRWKCEHERLRANKRRLTYGFIQVLPAGFEPETTRSEIRSVNLSATRTSISELQWKSVSHFDTWHHKPNFWQNLHLFDAYTYMYCQKFVKISIKIIFVLLVLNPGLWNIIPGFRAIYNFPGQPGKFRAPDLTAWDNCKTKY